MVLALYVRIGPVPTIDVARYASPTLVDRNGIVLYEPLASAGTRGEWMSANELPEHVLQATLAAEDARFFSHAGIDPIAIARAVVHDLRRRALVEGGSTISQQVAKLTLGASDRTVAQKIREAVAALRLEHRCSKREILALYLNLAPYGNQIHGIARASRRYFGSAPEDLTVAQAAFLASLPQRPSAFNPLRDPKAAATRQRFVLQRMRELGFVDRTTFEQARAERLRFVPSAEPLLAQHFIERAAAVSRPGRLKPAATLHIIRTTLDARLQRDVDGIIAANRESLIAHGAHSAAVAVLDNRTGEWLAWEGSGDYFGSEFGGAIDGVSALRQPGSTLKPFTYALAFENGYTPASVIADVPSSFPTAEEGVVYTPRNYDGRYRGPLRARAALAGSENVPAVALLSKLGPPALLQLLRSCGFKDLTKTADYYGLGLTLGDAEVSLEQLVAGYSIFARGGAWIEPRMLLTAEPRNRATAQPIFSRRTAFWITDILSDPNAREYIFGSGGSLDFPFPVAVKTGTSQAYRDNWTIGYTREVTVGVWVGNFDRQELRNSTGVTGAGPIFHAVMLAAIERIGGARSTIVDPPPTVERRPICATSGLRPSTFCPNIETEWIASETPVRFCSWHHDGYTDWPPEFRAWGEELRGARATPPAHMAKSAPPPALRIVNPPDGATYLIDPTLRAPYQTLHFRAMSSAPLSWRVDGRKLASSEWSLAPGRHTITAVDGAGNHDSVRIHVR